MFVNIPNVQHEELTHPAYSLALSFFKGSPVGDKSNYIMEKVGWVSYTCTCTLLTPSSLLQSTELKTTLPTKILITGDVGGVLHSLALIFLFLLQYMYPFTLSHLLPESSHNMHVVHVQKFSIRFSPCFRANLSTSNWPYIAAGMSTWSVILARSSRWWGIHSLMRSRWPHVAAIVLM